MHAHPIDFRGTLAHGDAAPAALLFPSQGSTAPVAALGELSHDSHHPLGGTKQRRAQGKSSSDGCPHQRKQIPESEPWDEKPLLHKPEARQSNVSAELPRCCSHASPALDAAGKLRALQLPSALGVEREAALPWTNKALVKRQLLGLPCAGRSSPDCSGRASAQLP